MGAIILICYFNIFPFQKFDVICNKSFANTQSQFLPTWLTGPYFTRYTVNGISNIIEV